MALLLHTCTRSLAVLAEVETLATGRGSPFNAERNCFEIAWVNKKLQFMPDVEM